jgi:hypothetical protein
MRRLAIEPTWLIRRAYVDLLADLQPASADD